MAHTASTQYRPDIDGLRALAVLPVIAFHLSVPMVSGGFVGVDVFFVISGYLITATLISDIQNSRFSIRRFYERRIRRIFPALFGMLFLTSVLAAVYLCPTDLIAFGKSLVCAVLSVSNIYFWRQQGDFEPESTTRPLLHTWSLGVEEQFYIFFPLVLALLHKRVSRQLRTIVLLTAVVSLLVSIISTVYAPESAFYLLPARAWELMAGSMLSLGMFPIIAGPARTQRDSRSGTDFYCGVECVLKRQHTVPRHRSHTALRRCCPADWRRPIGRFLRVPSPFVDPNCFYRKNLIFTLPVALAAHRLSADERPSFQQPFA